MTEEAFLKEHQRNALLRLISLGGRAGMWMRMRTGKTRVALSYAALERCERVLVVAPVSAIPGWESEFAIVQQNLREPWPVTLIDVSAGSVTKRKALIQDLIRNKEPAVVLVNWDVYWREPLRTWLLKWEPDAVILDESHRIRHRGSRRARFAHIISTKPHVRVCLALSGTPITNGTQDAWSVMRPIAPQLFGTFADFERQYLIMGGFRGKQIMGSKNEDDLHDKIDRLSFKWEGRFPEPTDVVVPVTLSAKTRKAYDTLKRKSIVELNDAQGKPRTVVATIVLTLILRLQQVTCGFTVDVTEQKIELGDEKARVAIDLIENAVANKERVIVFCRFSHDLDLLERMMPKDVRHDRIDGSRSSTQRRDTIAALHAGNLDVIIAQTKSASLGVDFTPANVGIFYSAGFSLDEFIQAKARMDGYNQSKSVAFYHLLATNTVDQDIYAALQAKTQIAQRVTDLSYALNLITSRP